MSDTPAYIQSNHGVTLAGPCLIPGDHMPSTSPKIWPNQHGMNVAGVTISYPVCCVTGTVSISACHSYCIITTILDL